MIQIQNITLSFGGQTVVENLSFILGNQERLALIGRNGTGKSTLLKLIMGELQVDAGSINISKNYQIGHLRQHISFTEKTVLEECTKGEYADYLAEKILFGLGFSKEDMNKPPSEFSGGYQLRIELTKCLIREPDLLLLDEPTNYLDILSIRWLEEFLKRYPGEMIIVSHDRDFLDKVCTHTAGIYQKKLKKVEGGTAKFHEQIALEKELESRTKDSIDRRKKELQSFVDRFGAKASTAAMAQSKLKMIEKLDQVEFSEEESFFAGFKFRYLNFEAKGFLEAKDLSFSYPGREPLFSNLSFSIKNGARLAIIGKNGKGKSTLLNLIYGFLNPSSGTISRHPKVEIGYFGQMNIDRLNGDRSVVDEITQANPALSISEVRSICGAMAFSSDLALKKVKVLSGGERARVSLGKILAKPCNLLLLDEPTHHLDLESIEILLREIRNFKGAVIVVTHDEFVLSQFATEIVAFHHGKTEYLPYDYQEFLAKIGWEEHIIGSVTTEAKAPVLNYKDQKKQRQEMVRLRSIHLKPILLEMEGLEKKIILNEDSLKSKQAEMLTHIENNVGKKIAELSIEISSLEKNIEESFNKLELLNIQKEDLEKLYPL
jgi:ATP-binding cassette, subfamily F, member 3